MFCAKAEASPFHSLGKTSSTELAAVWSSTGWTVTVPLPQSGSKRGTFFWLCHKPYWFRSGQLIWLITSGTCSVHFRGVKLHSHGITQMDNIRFNGTEKNKRAVQDGGKKDTQWQCMTDKNLLNKLLWMDGRMDGRTLYTLADVSSKWAGCIEAAD